MLYEPNKERLLERLDEFDQGWQEKLDCIERWPSTNFGPRINDALWCLNRAVVANAPRERVSRYLKLLSDVCVGNFVSATNPGNKISLPMGDAEIEFVGEATTAYMDVDTWLTGFFASVVRGASRSKKILCDVSEELFCGANIKPDLFDLAVVRVSKGLFDPEVHIAQLLVDAMEASDEKNIDPERLDFAWSIMLPFLMLCRIVVGGDPEGEYDEIFEDGMEQHEYIWQTEEMKIDPEGWVSLPLTAAACLIYDNKGIRFSKDTPWVPRWLVEELRS